MCTGIRQNQFLFQTNTCQKNKNKSNDPAIFTLGGSKKTMVGCNLSSSSFFFFFFFFLKSLLYYREWPAGKTESGIKLLIQENSKPQDPIMYTDGSVTKDRSRSGFTVKQGATTIHEDSAACSLTMEVEAVTYALRWIASRGDNQTTHATILTDSMSLPQKV